MERGRGAEMKRRDEKEAGSKRGMEERDRREE